MVQISYRIIKITAAIYTFVLSRDLFVVLEDAQKPIQAVATKIVTTATEIVEDIATTEPAVDNPAPVTKKDEKKMVVYLTN